MTDIRRYSLAAIVLLVVLRLAIGWQLLYEGLWKIDTLKTPKPWTSEGYLKNSVGPLRDTFRQMSGDPNELGWLDYDVVAGRWQDWANRFQKHYQLDDKQSAALARLLFGSHSKVGDRKVFAAELDKLPSNVEKLNVSGSVAWFDAKAKRLYVDAEKLLTPDDRARLESLVRDRTDAEANAFLTAVSRVYDRQKSGLGYLKKLAGALKGNPELLGNEDWQQMGKLDLYRQQLTAYEADYAKASSDFQRDHLAHQWTEIQTLRSELTGPIKAMETELKEEGLALLTLEQQSRGPAPTPWTTLKLVDTMTIVGLTGLGTLLLLGLCSRFAAIVAAFMLLNFYMAMPPFPGVPEAPGPEHSFIVNKNLIEVFALLALAAVPTGMWFGLDRVLAVFVNAWKADRKVSTSLKSTVATGDEPEDIPEFAAATT
ncbi:MAG: hypothetical protein R3C59_12705 [Planctomycetaceae bacterium]